MKTFKNQIEIWDYFTNNKVCKEYLEEVLWRNVPTCPYCKCKESYKIKTTDYYRCKNKSCMKTYNVLKGTIFENTKIELRLWFMAIFEMGAHKKGVAAIKLKQSIGVTYKSAWFIFHRIRESFNNNPLFHCEYQMEDVVEADETYVGGKNKNRHWDKKVKNSQGRSCKDKVPVLGLLQRGWFIRCFCRLP